MTFVGLTALFMNLSGKLSDKNPVVLMGIITNAYSLGMIIAPLYCVALYEKFNSYNYSLYITAIVVLIGALLLIYAKRIKIVKDNTVQGYHGDYFDAWGIIDDVEAAHGIKE